MRGVTGWLIIVYANIVVGIKYVITWVSIYYRAVKSVVMPEYQYVQIGLRPETIEELDGLDESRSEFVRRLVERELE